VSGTAAAVIARAGPLRDRAQQPRLADARLARDEQQPALTRRSARQPVPGQGEEGVPANQDRRLDGPVSPHYASPLF